MTKTILKYLSLYKSFFKASIIADLEYRVNFLTKIITDLFWYVAQIMTFEVLFHHTNRIGDWNLEQTRVFLGMVFTVDALYMIFLSENLDQFSKKVVSGDLDLLLAKPVNSQFMISLQRVSTAMFGNLVVSLSWLVFSLANLTDLQPFRLLWLVLLIPCGLICMYAVRFFFATTSIIFAKSENLQFIWYQISRLGMRPDSIYVPWFKVVILTILPVGIISSVPARSILEPANYGLFLWVFVWSSLLLYLSNRFGDASERTYGLRF